jgi:hypothetical protein
MLAGDIAPIRALENLDVHASVEFGRDKGLAFELMLWLGPSSAPRYVQAGEFWALWKFGELTFMVRFKHLANVFNRAMFEAVEMLPARARAQLPPGALWFPSEPRSPQP